MRRGLLIVLTLAVLLSAVPASAGQPSAWQGVISDLWSHIQSLAFGKLAATSPMDHTSGKNLPYLDPNGTELTNPAGDQTGTAATAASEEDDGNTLPYLDPNG